MAEDCLHENYEWIIYSSRESRVWTWLVSIPANAS